MNREKSTDWKWTEEELQVLYHVALKAYEISVESLRAFFPNLKSYSLDLIDRILRKAGEEKLIASTDLWGNEYLAGDGLLLQTLPSLKKLKKSFQEIQRIEEEDVSQPSQNRKAALKRNILFTLLFDKTAYHDLEQRLLPHPSADMIDFYSKLVECEDYADHVREIDIAIVNACLDYHYKQHVTNLYPVSENRDYFVKIKSLCAVKDRKRLYAFDEESPLFSYHPEKYNEKNTQRESEKLFNRALIALYGGKNEKALDYFTKGLQVEKKSSFPQHPLYGMWYFITLYTLHSEEIASCFEVMRKPVIETKQLQNKLWKPVIAHFFNEQDSFRQSLQELEEECQKGDPIDRIIYIIVSYLTENKLRKDDISPFINMIIGVYSAGYQPLALEAAYALRQLTGHPRGEELYRTLRVDLQTDPILSFVKQEEFWKKNFKLLESLLAKTKNIRENQVKISYIFHKERLNLQVVVQNKTEKGWSKARKIQGKDLVKIDSHHLAVHDRGMIAELSRLPQHTRKNIHAVAHNMINHPNIFSDDELCHPVLFIPGRIEIQVRQENGLYHLSTKSYHFENNTMFEEVAPDIYKIYTANENQQKIIQAILERHLTFPLSEKEEVEKIVWRIEGAMEN
ncbi:MAG: hypothetical protein LBV02_02195 [Bacteroidales bacterium]|jgi:hypothetical protein|nr:hypothetical protein [Bacteroidales bacterium]